MMGNEIVIPESKQEKLLNNLLKKGIKLIKYLYTAPRNQWERSDKRWIMACFSFPATAWGIAVTVLIFRR